MHKWGNFFSVCVEGAQCQVKFAQGREDKKCNCAHYILKILFPENDRAINVDSAVLGYDQENV